MMRAAYNSHIDVVELLNEGGADVNHQDQVRC